MISPRLNHQAVKLPNGKVLAVGGRSGSSYFSSAELYDPVTGTWSATGSMMVGRFDHTATLLPTGKVLISGGANDTSVLASAELYDPSTQTFTFIGSLNQARVGHTSVLLSNGKTLLAGGYYDNGFYPNSSELFTIPSPNDAGTWSSAGSMATTRGGHTATLLPDGKVLVAGGGEGSARTSAELYNPQTNTWSSTGSMNNGWTGHTAQLLPNGKVLICGGGGGTNSQTELYDPTTGTWSPAAPTPRGRRSHTLTLLPNGLVIIAGGNWYVSRDDLYNYASNTWLNGPGQQSLYYRTATVLGNGKVLFAGGIETLGGTTALSASLLYDPFTPPGEVDLVFASLMTRGRSNHTATLLPNGKVLIAGGYINGDPEFSSEIYDPTTNVWSTTNNMLTARRSHTSTLLPNGLVLVVGGSGGISAELYDPSTGVWSTAGNTSGNSHTATLLPNGKVLVVGDTSAQLYTIRF